MSPEDVSLDSSARAGTRPLAGAASCPELDVRQASYRLRFARTVADLDALQKLRFDVFNLELGEGLSRSHETGRDRDRFDDQCHHMMVVEEASGAVVGTYRMQRAEAAARGAGFYSASEFDLSSLPAAVLDDAVELGRACIAREHRSRHVLFLLWRGLARYVLASQCRYLFGCSSLTSQDPDEGRRAYLQLLQGGHVHDELQVRPRPEHECVADAGAGENRGQVAIPTLFGLYLRYGAKVLGPPALDRSFGTIDFLTFLDLAGMDERTLASFTR